MYIFLFLFHAILCCLCILILHLLSLYSTFGQRQLQQIVLYKYNKERKVNTAALVKKVQQRLYFPRTEEGPYLSARLHGRKHIFITVWYGNCSRVKRAALQRSSTSTAPPLRTFTGFTVTEEPVPSLRIVLTPFMICLH